MKRLPIRLFAIASVMGFAVVANAQHEGDIGVGRTSTGQLTLRQPTPGGTPCFDPDTGVSVLAYFPSSNTYRASDPGFDANFVEDANQDYFRLASGASIRLIALENLEPAFRVTYQAQSIRNAGDQIALGSATLHRHTIFIVDGNDPAFDPLRTLWYGRFFLRDVGTTAYADSDPFTLRVSLVNCTPGDVDNNGAVTFADIDPFVDVLGDPAAASVAERCAADCNRDGYVTFADIDSFVESLGG